MLAKAEFIWNIRPRSEGARVPLGAQQSSSHEDCPMTQHRWLENWFRRCGDRRKISNTARDFAFVLFRVTEGLLSTEQLERVAK
jgi:hypothetical protein